MMSVGLCASTAQAAITATGDVVPPNPATWTTSTGVYIGNTEAGSVGVDGGSAVVSRWSHLGYNPGSTGTVTVSGAGSSWTASGSFTVGRHGGGTLAITNGGAVRGWWATIGKGSGSTGAATVSGGGSTWTSSDSVSVGQSGDGTLDITNGGAVSGADGYIG